MYRVGGQRMCVNISLWHSKTRICEETSDSWTRLTPVTMTPMISHDTATRNLWAVPMVANCHFCVRWLQMPRHCVGVSVHEVLEVVAKVAWNFHDWDGLGRWSSPIESCDLDKNTQSLDMSRSIHWVWSGNKQESLKLCEKRYMLSGPESPVVVPHDCTPPHTSCLIAEATIESACLWLLRSKRHRNCRHCARVAVLI